MVILLLIVGVILIVVGLNGKVDEFTGLIKSDFTSDGEVASFPVWVMAIVLIGALGYSKTLKPISNAFLVLVFLAIFITNKGFITKFVDTVKGN